MDSYSKIESDGEDEAHDEELEHFDDFTLASSWERFISDIEAVCRQWTADGPKNLLKKNAAQMDSSNDLFKVKSDLKDVTKSYCMEYYFTTDDGKLLNWDSTSHDIQLCFGVKEFLLIAPQSASGVVLDAPESSKLLSAVAIALSNCSSLWPAFVPVHDPSRKAYIGIQNMGTVFTKRFEADYIGSQVPVKLMHLEGLYELFVSKFAYSTMDFSVHLFKVHFTMKLTYETFLCDDNDVQGAFADNEYGGSPTGEIHNRRQWDDDCPWSEWYSAEDPVKGFELVAVWSEKMVESSSEMAELENSSPYDAEKWILYPNMNDGYEGNQIGFSSQLLLLIDALATSFKAQFMEDFVSVENPNLDNSKTSRVIPPTTVVDHVLKELFHEGTSVALTFASSDIGGVQLPDSSGDEHKISRAIKGAPLQSLFSQFCLHALWFGNCNVRAISLLWMEFVQEVRWRWEESQSLPRMPANGSIDLTTCLINQKLQMLAVCIERKRRPNEDFHDYIGSEDWASSNEDDLDEVESPIRQTSVEYFTRKRDSSFSMPNDLLDSTSIVSKSSTKPDDDVVSVEVKPSDGVRKGSAGAVGLKLLKSNQSMHAPFTQDTPLMTEDMHEERIQAIEACSDSFNFSAQLEKEILSSDMSAFKAANPDAVFEDFIRWHSPGDWENGDPGESASSRSSTKLESKDDWPPQGRLSQRMSEHRNLWRKIWNDAPALPASEKKPLLDPNSEGEKILHYLETVRPHQLLEQMVCTAFRASADTLNRTSYGDFTEMTIKMDQLYRIMVSTLRPLQANSLSVDSEIIDDLRRLCVVFDHVEKLLTLAASLHRKFLDAPRLSEAIFSDYFSYYLPRMETSSTGEKVQKEFDKKQLVRIQERTVVSNMFVPPTANQSWRKVLSMGNLLNGHEPILREIIFSTRDRVSGNHYAVDPVVHQQEIEMYRMYICGTSNDLRVALSVTSCD